MAKRLILLRHAKSSWADRTQSDFDRPLNDRGRRDAPAMGRFIIDNALAPEIIFCSPSKRTLETLALLQETIGDDAHVEFADGLYLAEAKTLLKIAQNAGSQYASAMIIAHNPGLEMLALKLADAGTSDADALAR
ncbi:MAG: histidine phosphatase family protein, partial [Pseudomonadota bacterium]